MRIVTGGLGSNDAWARSAAATSSGAAAVLACPARSTAMRRPTSAASPPTCSGARQSWHWSVGPSRHLPVGSVPPGSGATAAFAYGGGLGSSVAVSVGAW